MFVNINVGFSDEGVMLKGGVLWVYFFIMLIIVLKFILKSVK